MRAFAYKELHSSHCSLSICLSIYQIPKHFHGNCNKRHSRNCNLFTQVSGHRSQVHSTHTHTQTHHKSFSPTMRFVCECDFLSHQTWFYLISKFETTNSIWTRTISFASLHVIYFSLRCRIECIVILFDAFYFSLNFFDFGWTWNSSIVCMCVFNALFWKKMTIKKITIASIKLIQHEHPYVLHNNEMSKMKRNKRKSNE